ncbi:MAG: hypothetical protein AB1847_21980 [bacterium]
MAPGYRLLSVAVHSGYLHPGCRTWLDAECGIQSAERGQSLVRGEGY